MLRELFWGIQESIQKVVDLASLHWTKLRDRAGVEELVEGASVAPPPRTVVDHGQDPVETTSTRTLMSESPLPSYEMGYLQVYHGRVNPI